MGPSTNAKSRFGSRFARRRHTTCPVSCTSTSSSTTQITLENVICPAPQSPWARRAAWKGYCFLIEMRTRLWNAPSTGRFMSTTSGKRRRSIGKNNLSVAFPSHASSIGGGPTRVAGYTAPWRCVIAERPFVDEILLWIDVSLEDEVGVGGDLQVHGLAFHGRDRALAQESCK